MMMTAYHAGLKKEEKKVGLVVAGAS